MDKNDLKINEAKRVLSNILSEIEKEKHQNKKTRLENDFKKILRYLYHNDYLKDESKYWIKQIENRKNISRSDLINNKKLHINNDDFDIFYPADNTHSNNYQYYINKLGILIIVQTNGDLIEIYNYQKDNTKIPCWILPIRNDGCIDGDYVNNIEFYSSCPQKLKLPVLIGNLQIYEQIKKTKLYETKRNYIAHHIICNNPDNESAKNDARDNRIDNIIAIPKKLHVHKTVDKKEKKEYAKLYLEYKKNMQ